MDFWRYCGGQGFRHSRDCRLISDDARVVVISLDCLTPRAPDRATEQTSEGTTANPQRAIREATPWTGPVPQLVRCALYLVEFDGREFNVVEDFRKQTNPDDFALMYRHDSAATVGVLKKVVTSFDPGD